MQQEDYDWRVKIVVTGDFQVGKTNIVLRFCENSFELFYHCTIGVDFKIKTIEVEEHKIKMQIWDLSGDETFRTLIQNQYKHAQAIILVYSVVDKESFTNITNWMNQIKQNASKDVCLLLIGNKIDDFNRQVSYEEGEILAAQFGIPFFETSAQEGINVDDAFYTLGKLLKEQYMQQRLEYIQFQEKVQPIDQEQQVDEYKKPIDQEQQVDDDEQQEDDDKLGAYTVIKIFIIGDSGVGKTNIFSSFSDNYLQRYSTTKTAKIEFKCNRIEIQNQQQKLKLELWDTNDQDINNLQINQERFCGFLLVYSVNDCDSFNNIKNWINSIKKQVGENVCAVLVGNKIDLQDRQVSQIGGEALAKQFGISFFETSAKEGTNIADVFEELGRQLDAQVYIHN